MAEVILATQTTPANPSAGNVGVFVDSADGFLKQVDSSGNVLKNMSGLPLALTGATQATRYAGGTASGPPVSGTFAKGDTVIGQDATLWVCTVAGSPGTWVEIGGSASGATIAYTENTALNLTITGSEQSIGVDTTFTADGTSRYFIEVFIPILSLFTNGDGVNFRLRENPAGANTDRGDFVQTNNNGDTWQGGIFGRRAITPSAGSITYRVNAYRKTGTGAPTVTSGNGGAGNLMAASLLVHT